MNNTEQQEWLITNGLGGYVSGSVAGANTRSYHGLLIASLEPPTDRYVLVADIEEKITIGGLDCYLQENRYFGKAAVENPPHLIYFSVADFPTWSYGKNDDWRLEKSIYMKQKSNTVMVRYKNVGKSLFALTLHPLYAFSNFMATFTENTKTDFYSEIDSNTIKTFAQYGTKPLFTAWNNGSFTEQRTWYKNIVLAEEKDRGYGSLCDYYQIGVLEQSLAPGEEIILAFSLEKPIEVKQLEIEVAKIIAERQKGSEGIKNGFYKNLLASSTQFLVHRNSTKSESVIAGYHWFADWGRDTMIAMRGLTIATGKKEISKSILLAFLGSLSEGMLPNRFPDYSGDEVEYNTIDATLWLFVSFFEYHQKFKDDAFAKKHLKVLKSILDKHLAGTRYNIHVTEEGFLYGGENGVQLTWMDAKVDGKVITPRIGCPVEINALWYNALKIYEFFCNRFDVPFDSKYAGVLSKLEGNFVKMFSNQAGTLYDVIVPGKTVDDSFRPNQLFAISLPYTLLNKTQQKKIFEAVKEKLYTPYGIRTLDINNPSFKEVYFGDQQHRDDAYHQGTVWPFLLYEYFSAELRIYGSSVARRKRVFKALEKIRDHFYSDAGIHCISEIFDGLNPKHGKGCIQQAWSVGAILKLYEDFNLAEFEI
ncbi:putative glycogen debranching enzyme [Pedobacter sp. UYP30]|uniref:amylo-alpha-1,6-glucosidase n=1 Tax=Pedobacter sp. UYP30 TaxID=1756400 RepID=UPI00339AB882